jgi:hypothetical protein
MSDYRGPRPGDALAVPGHPGEPSGDRRRPGREDAASPALVPLLRNPARIVVAGDPGPVNTFKIAAERAAASYSAHVWLTMLSTSEQAAAIYRAMRDLDAAYVARNSTG